MTDSPPTASFFDDRLKLSHWLPRLATANVPVPKTEIIPFQIDEGRGGIPLTWETDTIVEQVEGLGGEAFIRSEYKSAHIDTEAGSHIATAEPEHIDTTLNELIFQHLMGELRTGRQLVLREWVDLDYCPDAFETLHPEIRYFVRDGQVRYSWPRMDTEAFERVSDGEQLYQSVLDRIEDHRDTLDTYAECVAAAFEPTGIGWSVDFVISSDPDPEIFCIDMALDALYWSERKDGWHNISEHETGSKYNLEEQYGDDLEPPADDAIVRD